MSPLSICCTNFRREGSRSLYGCYKIGPFPNGKGGTVANTIRRFLLSEVSGVAFSEVEIPGIPHEYSAIAGVRESPLEIMINLKAVVLSSEFKFEEPEYGFLEASGPAVVTARSLVLPPSVQCVDPDQPIATLAAKGALRIKALISRGRGHNRDGFKWSPRTKLLTPLHSSDPQEVGHPHHRQNLQKFDRDVDLLKVATMRMNTAPAQRVFHLDPPLYPVQKVNSMIEVVESLSYREGFLPEENVCLEIWTNGSVHPRAAIHEAGREAVKLFHCFQHARYFNAIAEKVASHHANQPETGLTKGKAGSKKNPDCFKGGQRSEEGAEDPSREGRSGPQEKSQAVIFTNGRGGGQPDVNRSRQQPNQKQPRGMQTSHVLIRPSTQQRQRSWSQPPFVEGGSEEDGGGRNPSR